MRAWRRYLACWCGALSVKGFVIISETDSSAYVLGPRQTWGTLPNIDPVVFPTYGAARKHLRRVVCNGGRALANPGACRVISAKAAGL